VGETVVLEDMVVVSEVSVVDDRVVKVVLEVPVADDSVEEEVADVVLAVVVEV
jgi:hypothetical protein